GTPGPLRTARRPGHSLQLRVLEQAVVAVLTPDAGVLVAAEGAPEMWPAGAAVDADRPGLQLLGDLVGPHRIGMPDRRRQAVPAVVGDLDALLLAVERDRHADGPEDLVLGDSHGVGHVRKEGGLEEEPSVHIGRAAAAAGQAGALGRARGDVALDPLPLRLAD